MTKVVVNTISAGYLSVAAANANWDIVEAAFDNTLSRDGSAPNTMLADLDMGLKRIINLGSPTASTDAVRLTDLQNATVLSSLPSVVGNSGKFLNTDGVSAFWDTVLATDVINAPAGDIAATTVQAAINELDSEKIGKNIMAAKGDLLGASANDTPVIVPIGANGTILIPSSGDTDGLAWVGAGLSMWNGTLAVSVAANALTVAIKTDAGTDPSVSNPVYVAFRDVTLTTGTYTVLTLTAATSFVVSSGSTLGTVSAQAHRIYIIGVNDAGIFRLGVWNPWNNTNKALLGINEGQVYSSTAEGGAGAADSAQVLYTGTAVTLKAIRILGYFESTQATAGTWASEDNVVQIMGPGVPRTGDIVQSITKLDGAVATGTTTIPNDDTIPQITEGTEFISVSISPQSVANAFEIEARMIHSVNANVFRVIIALFRDAIANALQANMSYDPVDNTVGTNKALRHIEIGNASGTITYRVRSGGATASTVTFNGEAGARKFGGVNNSWLVVKEIFV